MKTVERLNLLVDAYTVMKDNDAALGYIRDMIRDTPKASARIYDYGIRIYKGKIPFAKSIEEKAAYADSVDMLHDLWEKNLGDRGNPTRAHIRINRAYDFYSHMPNRRTRVRNNFRRAIEANGEEAKAELLKAYFKVIVDDYAIDSIDTDALLNEYDTVYGLMERIKDDNKEQGLKDLDAMLVQSGSLSCEKLEEIYKPRYEASPNDATLMKKIVSAFVRINCTSAFQLMVAENYYKVEPSPETAAMLAKTFEDRGEFDKSLQYLREAIDGTTDVTAKANFVARAAISALGSKNFRQAADFARQAISINPANGLAHYLLAQAYMNGINTCSDNVFYKQTAFWLAADQLAEARRLSEGDAAQLANINRDLNLCRNNFPTDETLFERSINEGDRYNVNCGWITGSTTVRKR